MATRGARANMHIGALIKQFGGRSPTNQNFHFTALAGTNEVPLSGSLSARATRELDANMPESKPVQATVESPSQNLNSEF